MMKISGLKNKIIMISGGIAAIIVLGLMFFSPSQNASALSVSDEVQHRLIEAQVAENLSQDTVGVLLADDDVIVEESNEGHVLSEEEQEEFFAVEFGYVEDPKRAEFDGAENVEDVASASDDSSTPSATATLSENFSNTASAAGSDSFVSASNSTLTEVDKDNIVSDHRFRGNTLHLMGFPTPTIPVVPTEKPTQEPTSTPLPTALPTEIPTEEPTPVPTEVPTQVPTVEPTAEPTPVPTAVPTNTPVPTVEPTAVPTQVEPDIFWSAGFETGDLSEWTPYGSWLRQGDTATYDIQSQTVHTGNYAVELTIDTSSQTSQAAYLFFWNNQLPDAAYYSAWYYIPGNIDTQVWWNIMQWKSTYDGNTDHSRPVFVLDGAIFNQTALSLCFLPDKNVDKVCWKQTTTPLPQDEWVHIEVYYEKDKVDGHVIVWQDGVKLFDITGYPTVLSDGSLYYSVNHYTDYMEPDISSIFIDDVVISYDRIGD